LNPNEASKRVSYTFDGKNYELTHGSVIISSISNYTNACNPSMMLAAGLLAKKAYEMGLKKKPYIKTSLSPGCGNITKHYLAKSGMLSYLEAFGFIFFLILFNFSFNVYFS
jgi:aconitase A